MQADGTQLGMFATPAAASGCTSISVYGDLTLNYDWPTNTFSFSGWKSRQIFDAHGNPVLDSLGKPTYPVTPLLSGVSYFEYSTSYLQFAGLSNPDGTPNYLAEGIINSVVTFNYSGKVWPDTETLFKSEAAYSAATLAYMTKGTITLQPAAQFNDPIYLFVLGL